MKLTQNKLFFYLTRCLLVSMFFLVTSPSSIHANRTSNGVIRCPDFDTCNALKDSVMKMSLANSVSSLTGGAGKPPKVDEEGVQYEQFEVMVSEEGMGQLETYVNRWKDCVHTHKSFIDLPEVEEPQQEEFEDEDIYEEEVDADADDEFGSYDEIRFPKRQKGVYGIL